MWFAIISLAAVLKVAQGLCYDQPLSSLPWVTICPYKMVFDPKLCRCVGHTPKKSQLQLYNSNPNDPRLVTLQRNTLAPGLPEVGQDGLSFTSPVIPKFTSQKQQWTTGSRQNARQHSGSFGNIDSTDNYVDPLLAKLVKLSKRAREWRRASMRRARLGFGDLSLAQRYLRRLRLEPGSSPDAPRGNARPSVDDRGYPRAFARRAMAPDSPSPVFFKK